MTDKFDLFYVVVNTEEQYSLWPSYKAIPMGWKSIGGPKTKEECLDYIKKEWIDMRPLSLRKELNDKEIL